MKVVSKAFLKATLGICMVMACSITAFAGTGTYTSKSITTSSSGHSGFSKSWKDYGVVKINDNYYDFTYGYNTTGTNEDYIKDVYAQDDYNTTYYGRVKNSKGITDVTSQKTGTKKTGKADVKHTGTTVTYSVYAR